jgi:cysteine desulfurase
VGGGQQKGLRAGTENLSGIASFGAAAKAVLADPGEAARMAAIRDGFEKTLKTAIPDAVIFGAAAPRLCNTAQVAVPGLSAETILMALDLDGVAVSSGASCSSGKITPSHVLMAMGAAGRLAAGAIRVSFGWNSAMADGEAVVASLLRLVERVQTPTSSNSKAA